MGQQVDERRARRLRPLEVGSVAPDFAMPQTPLTRLALTELRDQRLALVFYPFDWEPVSREQLTLYETYSGDFGRLGAHLLGISVDHPWSHAAFAHDARITFPLLADVQPRGAVARAYGVYRPRQGVSARALFLLDRVGIVRFSQVYPDALNPGVDGLLSALEALASLGAD